MGINFHIRYCRDCAARASKNKSEQIIEAIQTPKKTVKRSKSR
jgi:hypothetical protein